MVMSIVPMPMFTASGHAQPPIPIFGPRVSTRSTTRGAATRSSFGSDPMVTPCLVSHVSKFSMVSSMQLEEATRCQPIIDHA